MFKKTWVGITLAVLIVGGGITASYYFNIYMSPANQLVRACQDQVRLHLYVPDRVQFYRARVAADSYAWHARLAEGYGGQMVQMANEQLQQAQMLLAGKLGEVEIDFAAENRMGVPLPGSATCTYNAAPGLSTDARIISVSAISIEQNQMGLAHPTGLNAWLDAQSAALMNVVQQPPKQKLPDASAFRPTWQYSPSQDQMSGAKSVTAMLTSVTTLHLSSPYDRPQNPILSIRQLGPYADAMIMLESGQFECSGMDGCSVQVRFDDGASEWFQATTTTADGAAFLSFNDAKKFVEEMEKAKRVRIQPMVYANGAQLMEFYVSGFDASKLIVASSN